jgi:enoyl-CoA hydratase
MKADFMAYETIIVEIEDHVALIKLNRPDALNALNDQLMSELAQALGEAQKNDKVRCILLTGSEKAFAAGADIKMMSGKGFVDVFLEDLFTEDSDAIARVRKPIIAAVSGYALGGGCELAMMCDFIICSDTAKFGQPEINLGVIAGLGGTQRLTRLVGKSRPRCARGCCSSAACSTRCSPPRTRKRAWPPSPKNARHNSATSEPVCGVRGAAPLGLRPIHPGVLET